MLIVFKSGLIFFVSSDFFLTFANEINNITTMQNIVIWKYQNKTEKRKQFSNFMDAMNFQRSLLKRKNGLEYAKYE